MTVAGADAVVLLVGRVLFGGVLAFMGLNHFLQSEEMVGYARHKGLPAPTLSVFGSGAVLVAGSLGIVVGAFAVVSALAVATFLVVAAVTMHDFWAVDAEQTEDELTHFLKNLVMAGGALAIAALGWQHWGLSLGVGLL